MCHLFALDLFACLFVCACMHVLSCACLVLSCGDLVFHFSSCRVIVLSCGGSACGGCLVFLLCCVSY
jgi:hypothetical protein